ncbi:hypothetical protein [Photobacterium kagoshimensis]|uniref:hypothetical protein n=1 Tax=Photobacterium kagoshimensis TaxID=2910242 RepID=UPI003D136427
MKLFKRKSANSALQKKITSAATRRKRLSINVRRKVLWRQRSYSLVQLGEVM